MMNRRQAIVTLASIALLRPRLVRAAPLTPGPLAAPGADLAGCANSWRAPDLPDLTWDDALVPGCLDWAQHQIRLFVANPRTFKYKHSPAWDGRECIYGGEADWSEAFTAWTKSPPHLDTLRHARVSRVGMAGYFVQGNACCHGNRAFWVLRVA
jgi:hypothetical protein